MEESDREGACLVALPEFEGPLDLLLHLVRRHELDIFDIPISFITEKYLEYLDLMRSLNLDVAGEYLLMAATLAHIKSQQLLPRPEAEEELAEEDEGDPREELIRRLLEYQKYKEAALELGGRPTLGRQIFRRGAPLSTEGGETLPFVEVGAFALIAALAEAMKRSQVKLTHDVLVDRISITDRINHIVDRLAETETLTFEECFGLEPESEAGAAQLRHDLVVTFLAILEMARLHMIRILQHLDSEAIYLTRTGDLRTVENLADDYG
jgi:segregation and condensation protein A